MAGIEDSRQNDQRRQGQEAVPDWERIVKIMRVKAMGSSIDKAHLHVFCRIMKVRFVVVMVMRVAVHMSMRGRMVRLRSMGVVS